MSDLIELVINSMQRYAGHKTDAKSHAEHIVNAVREHDKSRDDAAINIIIDDSDVQNQVFVEIENDKGQSIRIGEELTTDEGYRRLRINITKS